MGGKALALLKDDSCGACGVGLSAAECQNVRNNPEPVRCHQCGRILYAG
jgi:predicted  nucleic acid-binding Zn-ribbon protein